MSQEAKQVNHASDSADITAVVAEAHAGDKMDSGSPPPPIFTGNFDLYSHRLSFLSEVYLPKGTKNPRYEDLYNKILYFQAKPDRTVQIYLAPEGNKSLFYGEPHDPFTETPLENVVLESIKTHKSLTLPKVAKSFTSSTPRPGVSATIALNGGHCGMQSLSGTLRMSRLWTKPTGGGNYVELFEGHITYDLKYSALYRRKGHGSGESDSWSFWAIRAKVGADGFEAGIQAGIKPVAINSSMSVPRPVSVDEENHSAGTNNSISTPGILKLEGEFNFYSMSDLTKNGLAVDPFPSYRTIHDIIIENEPKVGMECIFNAPDAPNEVPEFRDSKGCIRGSDVIEPFFKLPLQFEMTSIEQKDLLSFTEEEAAHLITPHKPLVPAGPGAIITLKLTDIHLAPRCTSVDDATGSIKLVRAWAGKNDRGEPLEVFEAYLEWEIKVDPRQAKGIYRSKYSGVRGYWVIRVDDDDDDDDDEIVELGESGDEEGWEDTDDEY